jgi:hypothetical protein
MGAAKNGRSQKWAQPKVGAAKKGFLMPKEFPFFF